MTLDAAPENNPTKMAKAGAARKAVKSGGAAEQGSVSSKASGRSVGERSEMLKAFRVASREDVLRLEPIAREAHAESRYRHIPFSQEKFLKANRRILTGSEDALALYITLEETGDSLKHKRQYQNAESEKLSPLSSSPRIVGLLGAEVGEYFLGTGPRIATCHVLYVSGTIRTTLLGGKVGTRMLRLFADWAKSRGAEELNIHVTSGIAPERTDKLLRRLGFVAYGGNYAGRVG